MYARGLWHVNQGAPENFHIGSYRLKRSGLIVATAVARYAGVELVNHNRNGRIASRNSYGNDRTDRPG